MTDVSITEVRYGNTRSMLIFAKSLPVGNAQLLYTTAIPYRPYISVTAFYLHTEEENTKQTYQSHGTDIFVFRTMQPKTRRAEETGREIYWVAATHGAEARTTKQALVRVVKATLLW